MSTSVGQTPGFIDLLRAACDDWPTHLRLRRLLSLPDAQRRSVVRGWVRHLAAEGRAPKDFIQALACLEDDAVAQKAHEVVSQGRPATINGDRVLATVLLGASALGWLVPILAWQSGMRSPVAAVDVGWLVSLSFASLLAVQMAVRPRRGWLKSLPISIALSPPMAVAVAMTLYANAPVTGCNAGRLALAARDTLRASREFSWCLGAQLSDPARADALLGLSRTHSLQGRFDRALADAEQAFALRPARDSREWRLYAKRLQDAGEVQRSRDAAARAEPLK